MVILESEVVVIYDMAVLDEPTCTLVRRSGHF